LAEPDGDGLHEELRAALKAVHRLEREARKAEARYQELERAYQMTVRNLVTVTGTCARLESERDQWREHAERGPSAAGMGVGELRLSRREVAAIRKAMARLHHPDVGGDPRRMQAWNTLLDALEQAAPDERR
jgi:hypothetical protein